MAKITKRTKTIEVEGIEVDGHFFELEDEGLYTDGTVLLAAHGNGTFFASYDGKGFCADDPEKALRLLAESHEASYKATCKYLNRTPEMP